MVLKYSISFICALFLSALIDANAASVVVASHVGSTDPLAEGWTQRGTGLSIIEGPINDGGVSAWSIDDNSSIGGSARQYHFAPTPEEVNRAELYGWTLRGELRVVDVPDQVGFSVSMAYGNDNFQRFEVKFGSDSSGDPIVALHPFDSAPEDFGPSYTVTGGKDGYHRYELIYDPLVGNADLFVNGIEVISDYTGAIDTLTGFEPYVAWGARSSPDIGHGNYARIEFLTAVPLPPAFLLFGSGVLGLIVVARRKKA